MTDRAHKDLDALFAQGRSAGVVPSDDLMARVLADAARVQSATVRGNVRLPAGRRLAWLHDLIGGWPAWGGVVAAGLTGLWVGVAPPASIEGFAATLIGTTQTVTFLPETDLTLFEESSDG
ncbi:hypothetical protein ACOI1H_04970 [Loktanella sp. DJP18]|uniref:hypothetical protein n=1 Tax=Loktanella sp. DJP18 TaxID=3409788 RepID=UPI003BB813D9